MLSFITMDTDFCHNGLACWRGLKDANTSEQLDAPIRQMKAFDILASPRVRQFWRIRQLICRFFVLTYLRGANTGTRQKEKYFHLALRLPSKPLTPQNDVAKISHRMQINFHIVNFRRPQYKQIKKLSRKTRLN